jgi:hypothetical protein
MKLGELTDRDRKAISPYHPEGLRADIGDVAEAASSDADAVLPGRAPPGGHPWRRRAAPAAAAAPAGSDGRGTSKVQVDRTAQAAPAPNPQYRVIVGKT